MAEYIEREAVINRLLKVCVTDDLYGMGIQTGVDHAIDVIKEAPAADVAPVVHGLWIPSEDDFDDDDVLFDVEDWCDWQCSACHEDICYEDPMERRWLTKYCPNCGAKMDGEENE